MAEDRGPPTESQFDLFHSYICTHKKIFLTIPRINLFWSQKYFIPGGGIML